MPFISKTIPKFKPNKDVQIEYRDFSGGWNNIFKPTELKDNELAQADNLRLTGKGVPTGRWGSEEHFLAGSGYIRLITDYRAPSTSAVDLLALTDSGFLVKKSGASYTIITGASFASGYNAEAAQLGGNVYIASTDKPFVRYDGTNLLPYDGLSTPTGTAVSNISGGTGTTSWGWRVSALSKVGETLASTSVSLISLPLDISETSVNVAWAAVSAASGVLTGYSIYRGPPGSETYLTTVASDTLDIIDIGTPASDTIFPANADSTLGASAKYVLKFDDRLVLSGIKDDPTLVLISGRYPFQDRFNWADGGGYIRIDPDAGDEVTGLGISGSQTQGGTTPASVLVFFKNSVHQMVLKTVEIGNFVVLDPQSQVLSPAGCTSGSSIVPIENNTFYFGDDGINTVGSEAAFLNQIRTKEISARVRTYIDNLSPTAFEEATAGYMDKLYLLSFRSKRETIVYDWERAAFMGPWKTPWGITRWFKHYDSDNELKRLAGDDTGYVRAFDPSINNDSGTAIVKILRTRKEDFKDWSVLKVVKLINVLFRNISGSVTVNIRLEERNGNTVTEKAFNITGGLGTAGWGTPLWGGPTWGTSTETVSLTGEEIIRWTQLYKTARILQIEVTSSGSSDNWEFLGVRADAQPLPPGSLSSSTRV